MALYFCLMSAFAWFVFFALSWLLASGFKWYEAQYFFAIINYKFLIFRGHEAIEARSHIFHLFAWGAPAIQTILVLALGKVEGN